MDVARAMMMVTVMCLASLSGCFGEEEISEELSRSELRVMPSVIPAGEWVTITLKADSDMSVFFPYFLQDPGSMRAQMVLSSISKREILFPSTLYFPLEIQRLFF